MDKVTTASDTIYTISCTLQKINEVMGLKEYAFVLTAIIVLSIIKCLCEVMVDRYE